MGVPDPEELTLVTEDRGDRLVIRLSGELDVVGAPEVESVGVPPASAGRHVVLDLRGLTFMDSSGVRAVLAVQTAAGVDGGRLSLVPGPVDGPVARLFELSGLDRVLELVEDPAAP